MRISFWRFVLIVATAVSLISYPKAASATTVEVSHDQKGCVAVQMSRARKMNTKDWGKPRPFWVCENLGNYRTTKFRSFSLVYL